jgi:hypothetical protein
MAKKRKRARKKASNPAKKRKHTRKRASNPKRSHARRARRAVARNPSRRRSHRRRASNPVRSHRRARRNPAPAGLMDVGIAVLAGLGGFLATQAIGWQITSDQVKDGQRNRGLVGVALAAGGAFAAHKGHHSAGAGLALGSLLGAFGGALTMKMLDVMPKKSAPTASAVFQDNMSAVFQDNMSAVFQDNMAGYQELGMGAYSQELGELVPAAPWLEATPFG